MPRFVTASMLYDFVQCPHRVTMDLTGDATKRDPISPFVQLLWESGHAFEEETIEELEKPVLDLSGLPSRERERRTAEAMDARTPLIHGGRIRAADLLGDPDLLRLKGRRYVAGDIKSGAGLEGTSEDSDGKPKLRYAVQLALYTDILERNERAASRRPFILDAHGEEVTYDLDAPQGPRKPYSLWTEYKQHLASVRSIVAGTESTSPAGSSECKMCHWRTVCGSLLEEADDLTLIPELGRRKRDDLRERLGTVQELAKADLSGLIRGGKTIIPGIGADTLRSFQARARLQKTRNAKPFLRERLALPSNDLELFFDVETDPFRDICYLHGFVERHGGDRATERYRPFFATEPDEGAEERAFRAAWRYVRKSGASAVYYYSPYERTAWRRLRKKHPSVCKEDELETFFSGDRVVDLYQVVRRRSYWPSRDHSIKTLASFLGFSWRDPEPSGAASIEWFHCWCEAEDEAIRKRILEYNEDDCRAMRVLLDALRGMPVRREDR